MAVFEGTRLYVLLQHYIRQQDALVAHLELNAPIGHLYP